MDKKKIALVTTTCAGITAGLDYAYSLLLNVAPLAIKVLKNPELSSQLSDSIVNDYLLNPINVLSQSVHNDLFIKAQPLFLGFFGFSVAKKLWNNRKHKIEDASDYGAYGTSRWATEKEIFEDKDITSNVQKEGVLLASSKGNPIILKEATRKNKHVAVFGGSGAGKSEAYVKPNILNTTDKSIVVTDPKGILYEETAEIKRKQGYKVKMINYKDLHISERQNPFDYINEEEDALKVARTLLLNATGKGQLKDDFWDKSERALLSAFILYIKYTLPKEQHHFGSVFNFVTASYKTIHRLFRELEPDHIARKAYAQGIEKLDEKLRANVFISLAVTLDLWKYKKVCEFTYTSDFMLSDIGKEKTIVYVVLPLTEDQYKPLIGMFFTQLFSELYALADRNFNKLPVPVRFLLDEFNNIGRIPNFEIYQSTSRSYGIEISMIIQSIGQLRDRYGKEKADELIDNSDTRLFLGTNAPDSAKYFSELLGSTTIRIQSQSETKNDKGESLGQSLNVIKRPLKTPDELLRIDDDEAIVFIKGKLPFLVEKAWSNEITEFKSMKEEKISRFDYPIKKRGEYQVFHPKEIIDSIFENTQPQETETENTQPQEKLKTINLEKTSKSKEKKPKQIKQPTDEINKQPQPQEKPEETKKDAYDELESIF
ncbi:type IV secretory system conjugative DNA transfer family protein [Bacillus cereus]|uniref:VirD4-like conjugal transfer protein, CD1115 family n=1 Tax=Bacillus cereus TaxID=1396 RepID=UPI0021127041|nr:type IV secretory system conjugative DNA transfer family protein [Bacillus cereus]